MADYIDQGVLLQRAWDAGVKCGYIKAVDVEELLSLPIAEGVTRVCRCMQCAYAKWSERSKAYYCQRRWAMHKVRERDFCSYGRRKDGET